MPPPTNGMKRKTLAERAGETARQAPAPPSSRPMNAYIRATSIAGAPREPSFGSSISSSRPSSVSSMRNVSNSSYSSSLGMGNRPPSAQTNRAQSALGHSRLQRPHYGQNRPATSLEVHPEESIKSQVLGKRKGETPFSSGCESILEYSPLKARSLRDVSIATAMKSLNLCETPIVHYDPRLDAGVPSTPSQIPKMVPRALVESEIQKPSRSPKKTPKPITRFLNKDTNNTVVVWDHDSRLEEVENMCSQFKEEIKGATAESNGLKEMTAVYKNRSTSARCSPFIDS